MSRLVFLTLLFGAPAMAQDPFTQPIRPAEPPERPLPVQIPEPPASPLPSASAPDPAAQEPTAQDAAPDAAVQDPTQDATGQEPSQDAAGQDLSQDAAGPSAEDRGSADATGGQTAPTESQAGIPIIGALEPATRTLSVSGIGHSRAPADEAVLTLGVSADADTAKGAYEDAARQLTSVVQALGTQVPARALQTSGVSLQPRYEARSSGAPRLLGYTAVATLTITVEDPTRAGDLLDAAVAAGANDVRGIQYQLKNADRAREQALDEAVAQARSVAEQVAGKLGEKVGQALTVTVTAESGGGPVPMMAARARDESVSMPVLVGQENWTSQVQVTFELAEPTTAPATR